MNEGTEMTCHLGTWVVDCYTGEWIQMLDVSDGS